MKFQKNEVLKEIKARLDATNLKQLMPDRSIEESLEPLMALVGEEDELGSFVDRFMPIFESNNRGYNKVKSDAFKDGVASAQKPEETPPATPPQTFDNEAITKIVSEALAPALKEVSDLKAELNTYKGGIATEEVRAMSLKAVKELWGERVANVSMRNFDFSQEGAQEKFSQLAADNAKDMGVPPKASEGDHKEESFKTSEGAKALMAKKLEQEKNV